MKKWSGGVLVVMILIVLVLRYVIVENPLAEMSLQSPFSSNASDHLHWQNDGVAPGVLKPRNASQVASANSFVSYSLTLQNFTAEERLSLKTWSLLDHLLSHAEGLPHAIEAIKEAGVAWKSLMGLVQEEKQLGSANESARPKAKERQCPYSIRKMNTSEFGDGGVKIKIPCGLIQGSSITIIGTPDGLLGNFRIDLIGSALPGEPDPPIILHYTVRLHGDKVTEDPVIVQNTWTTAQDWGAEERCPSPDPDVDKKVDELKKCSALVDRGDKWMLVSGKYSNGSRLPPIRKEDGKQRRYFPFKQGYLAIATLRVGVEGIHMTVDGKHITSFAYRESLEPWLVSEVRISGDINLLSVLASGLPTSEDLEHIIDLEVLKSAPLPLHKPLDLFIGIFSTANNFKHRMAVRRTWMQSDAVQSGAVAVRFFVGLHKNQLVNEELWNEARTYGDIQLMPFVDYYSLITWKTIAICIYGTNVVSARYIMKTDDDSFVRVDELLLSLKNTNVTCGLLYGRINKDARPDRNTGSKWYTSPEEWPDETYPPWAHGPGYVVSQDIAKAVYEQHSKGLLRMFKLEDVAMGIWIAEMKRGGLNVKYVKEGRVYTEGCEPGYVVAHYQRPRDMLCLWQKLQETKRATCCRKR